MGNCFGEFDDTNIEFTPIINNKIFYGDTFILSTEDKTLTFGELKEKLLDFSGVNDNHADFIISTKNNNTKWKKRSEKKITNFNYEFVMIVNKKSKVKYKFDVDFAV